MGWWAVGGGERDGRRKGEGKTRQKDSEEAPHLSLQFSLIRKIETKLSYRTF